MTKTAEEWAQYNADCAAKRKQCDLSGHDWRQMTWQEAYPASNGKVCAHCDLVRLNWFTTPASSSEGGELNAPHHQA
jgi:hypothetical protein